MFRAIAVYLVVLLGFVVSGFWQVSKADEPTAEPSVDAKLLTSQLIETFDLILANHVSPPTMQQMVQGSIATVYAAANAHAPAAMAKEISNSTGDSLRSILERELSKVGSEETTLLDCIPRELVSIGVTVTPMKAQIVNEQLAANRYVGIGIAIHNSPGETTMAKVFPDGPAYQAGAEDGDVIIEVDGKSTVGVKLNQVIDWIRGVRGSKVEVLARRKGKDQMLTMTRDVVPFASVSPVVYSKSEKTVGIKLDRVSASSVHELRKVAAGLDPNVQTVVLDLRRVSGTDNLHYGELLASALINDATIGFVSDRDGKQQEVKAEKGSLFSGRQSIAVIDGSTSGVLKWIAAALQDSGQAVIYGSPAAMSATTARALKLSNNAYSVTMPTHLLHRASGEPLYVQKVPGFRLSKDIVVAQPRPDSKRNRELPGILYPDKSAPVSSPRQPFAKERSQANSVQYWELKPMIEFAERDASTDPSPGAKPQDR